MSSKSYLKGRGAQINTKNRFFEFNHEQRDDFLEFCRLNGEPADDYRTSYLPIYPKTLVNMVKSPDVGMKYSMNPYQGCEHGCVYCYARNTHEYWGYSAGLDFERQILVKQDTPDLLHRFITRKNWNAYPIVLSGNTDCYQPAERRYKITRRCLEIFLKYKHPVAIITKNALILRDLDIIKELAKDDLISISVSITSLDDKIRRLLEPRTAAIQKRLRTVQTLASNGIPVNVMMAPIIPAINSHEILDLGKASAEAGALGFNHTIVRLNGAIGAIFRDWIKQSLPDRADKVLNQIASCHGGTLNDSRFGKRMRGEGEVAKQIHRLVTLVKQTYFRDKRMPELNCNLHASYKSGQLRLF